MSNCTEKKIFIKKDFACVLLYLFSRIKRIENAMNVVESFIKYPEYEARKKCQYGKKIKEKEH